MMELGLGLGFLLTGCREGMMSVEGNDAAIVVAVTPAAGASAVDPLAPLVIEFRGRMMPGAEQFVALHEGDSPAGPVVPGTWSWSADRRVLTYSHPAGLRSRTRYTIHLGGGLADDNRRPIDHAGCARLGARTATPDMMSGVDMGSGGGMMAPGWRDAQGTYGMLFTFTTR